MLRNDLVKVDIFDNEIGNIEKMDAHTQAIMHRAFSVFLVNSKGEIYMYFSQHTSSVMSGNHLWVVHMKDWATPDWDS